MKVETEEVRQQTSKQALYKKMFAGYAQKMKEYKTLLPNGEFGFPEDLLAQDPTT